MRAGKEARAYAESVAAMAPGNVEVPYVLNVAQYAFQAGVNFERARVKALEKSMARK